MGYLWLKSIHVFAMVAWMGGTLAVAIILAVPSKYLHAPDARLMIGFAMQRWDRAVTAPAMLVTWIAGLSLALWGHWFTSAWLIPKIAIVLGLSAVHGVLAGHLRRWANMDDDPPRFVRFAPAAILTALFVIVVLVICKPI